MLAALEAFREENLGDAGRDLDQGITNGKKKYTDLDMTKIAIEDIHDNNNNANKNGKDTAIMGKKAEAF